MTNEIKEILDDIRKTADNTNFVMCSSQEELDKMPRYTANFMSINDRKAKLLLDYITNLQEYYNDNINKYEKLIEKYSNLQEENEKKERLITQYAEGMCAYANRIDKAVEYINHEWFKREQIGIAPLQFSYDELQDLLEILRGDE